MNKKEVEYCKTHDIFGQIPLSKESKNYGEWVALSERKPPEGESVWIYLPEYGMVETDTYYANEDGERQRVYGCVTVNADGTETREEPYEYISNGFWGRGEELITHWMPIEPINPPAPPKNILPVHKIEEDDEVKIVPVKEDDEMVVLMRRYARKLGDGEDAVKIVEGAIHFKEGSEIAKYLDKALGFEEE